MASATAASGGLGVGARCRVRIGGFLRFGLGAGDRCGAGLDFGEQPQPSGVGGGRGGAGRRGGVSDQRGFARLPGEFGDLVGGGLRRDEPRAGGEPQLRKLGHLLGEFGVTPHPFVDLGDLRCAIRAPRSRRRPIGRSPRPIRRSGARWAVK